MVAENKTKQLTPLKVISNWRQYAKIIAQTIQNIIPEAKTYLIGGAAENRLTIKSDIDILVVLLNKPDYKEAVKLRAMILEKAEEQGLPPYAPIELRIIGEKELKQYTKKTRVKPITQP